MHDSTPVLVCYIVCIRHLVFGIEHLSIDGHLSILNLGYMATGHVGIENLETCIFDLTDVTFHVFFLYSLGEPNFAFDK